MKQKDIFNNSNRLLKWFALVCLLTVGLLIGIRGASAIVEPDGWYAGDMHVHRSCGGAPIAVSSMYQKLFPQNLTFMSLLADMGNGEVQDPEQDLPRVTGQDDPISTPGRIVHWDAEWHWDPTYYQYPHQALGGHIVTLGLNNAYQIREEYTYPILKWAQQQNGIAGFAHMQYLDDSIPQTLTCCTPIEYPVEVALGSADFISEDDFGSDSAIRAYYRLLNSGFRPGFAAGTDYPCNNPDVGSLLTYAQVSGESKYLNWIDAIKNGRTVISRNGHNEFLNLTVNGDATPGDEINLIDPGSVQVTITWTANQPLSGTIELVNNGAVVANKQTSVSSGKPSSLSTTVNFNKSGWLAARRMGANGHQVHTGAVFVTVNNTPVRASAADAQFYIQWIDNLLEKTSSGGAWNSYFINNLSDAQSRYRAAKAIYQQIALEAGSQPQVCCSIWSTSTIPGTITENDGSASELGVKFRSDVNGNITRIRFYKGPGNTGTHVGSIWSSTGTLLGRVTFTGETGSGWQEATFATPVAVTAGTTYVASYHTNVGYYSVDNNYFASSGVDNAPLHALNDSVNGGNGVYVYSANSAFPSNTYASANYWVDVVFSPATGTTSPAITGNTPASGATEVNVSTAVTAIFSEAMNATTINTNTFELHAGNAAGAPVPASVSYNNANFTATLQPSSRLANSTNYTAIVKGGSTDPGVKNVAGNALAADYSWSFTTTDSGSGSGSNNRSYSVWSASVKPVKITENDAGAVELGMKFRSDISGYITGIRFYKGPKNTGTHAGSIWSRTGTLLGRATFSKETATGWQEVNFTTPVAITANTTYVVSYHTNAGYYSEDDNYFASSGVNNAPLHALKNGSDGGNGVYVYNTKPAFPSNTYASANYWVDVIFTAGG
ncbi:MAG TPA: DUF4082 domain-containing protein [Candidatus Methylomirabilis sp.]|nr:DUF4082 domain-containing protein [Candidatus Methylomirabilis sp.]